MEETPKREWSVGYQKGYEDGVQTSGAISANKLDHLALAVLGLSIRDQQNPEECSLRLAAAKRLLSRLAEKE
jgi:hypothetical protein